MIPSEINRRDKGDRGDRVDRGGKGDRGVKGDRGGRRDRGGKEDRGDRGVKGYRGDKGVKGYRGRGAEHSLLLSLSSSPVKAAATQTHASSITTQWNGNFFLSLHTHFLLVYTVFLVLAYTAIV